MSLELVAKAGLEFAFPNPLFPLASLSLLGLPGLRESQRVARNSRTQEYGEWVPVQGNPAWGPLTSHRLREVQGSWGRARSWQGSRIRQMQRDRGSNPGLLLTGLCFLICKM